MTIVTDYRRQM